MVRQADFNKDTKENLAKKVGYLCSNPFCRCLTVGANNDHTGTISIGEAAHITAAEAGGPRYNPNLTIKQRKDESNGIWLCRNHAVMIDRDETFFTVDLLMRWKKDAERETNERLEGIIPSSKRKYSLMCLIDDMTRCKETLDYLNEVKFAVVIPASEFPVPIDYEEKIADVIEFIGVDHSSKIRGVFRDVSAFKEVLEDERKRYAGRSGRLADDKATLFSHRFEAFLDRMDGYQIADLLETVGNLLYG